MSEQIKEQVVSDDYFKQRELKQGSAGWVLLAFLGIAYVISGDFAGWNFGIEKGGWGGLLVATILMGLMYLTMVLSLAELATVVPTAGGGYGFARRAFGPFGGFATGTAILIEYACAPAAIAVFIAGYCASLFGADGSIIHYFPEIMQSILMLLLGGTWVTKAFFFAIFIGIHLYGVGEALKLLMIITVLAIVALLIYVVVMIPYFDMANLSDTPIGGVEGAEGSLFPFGGIGILAAIPFGMWFFLGVEGVPLAAEESKNPKTDMPRGIITAMIFLLIFAILILFFGPGGSGAYYLQSADDPLIEGMRQANASPWIMRLVNIIGLSGLVASFFSLIYAASRQVFALSRAGYFPTFLSLTGSRKTPWLALLLLGGIGFALSLTGRGDELITMAVFGAIISYVMMTASHFVLRTKEPNTPRAYKTPGGRFVSGISVTLGVIAFVACFISNQQWFLITLVVYIAFLVIYFIYSRHHLVAGTPEEELAAIQAAEEDLN